MKRLKDILSDPRIIIILAPLILLSPIYLTGKALFWGTPSTQFIPWWKFAWETIMSGQLPLWNPLVGMGAPLAANYQSALFYPPTWLYFIMYFLGGIKAMAWSVSLLVALHLIWSGYGTAYLLRELGANRFGQALGGLAFSLSGYLVARAGFLSINSAVSWLPWLLLSLYLLAEQKSGAILKVVCVLTMMLLAGHAQTAWISILFGGLWVLYWGISSGSVRDLGRSIAAYVGSGLIAGMLSAVQLIPTAEYLLFSQRADAYSFENAMTYSFWPWRFLGLIMPDLFGNPATGNYWGYGNYWEDAVYIGLLPFLLAAGYVARSIRREEKEADGLKSIGSKKLGIFLSMVIIISFLLGLGTNTVIFPFLYKYVPGFDLFQAPTRYSLMAVMSMAILAGLGASQLAKPQGKKLYFIRLAVAASFSIAAAAIIAGYTLPDVKSSFLSAAGRAGIFGLLIAASFLLLPDKNEGQKSRIWSGLMVCFVALDLLSAGWGLNPGVDLDFYEVPAETEINGRVWMPSSTEYFLKFDKYFTFEAFSPDIIWEEMHEVYLPNLPILRGLETVNNFDPIVPSYYKNWMDGINSGNPNQHILELMNVGAVIDLDESGAVELKMQDAEYNQTWIVGCAEILNLAEDHLDRILENNLSLLEDIVVVSGKQTPCISEAQGNTEIISETNGQLHLTVDLDQDGWVLWSQTWYPGWKYVIDGGEKQEVYRVNYLFQGAPVPAGTHQVDFIYRPASILWGSVISASSLALGGFLLLNRKKKSKI